MALPATITLSNGVTANALISIVKNGVSYALPEPSTFESLLPTISKGGRNATGNFVGQYVTEKFKVTATWKFLTADQWAYIISFFSPRANALGNNTHTGSFENEVVFYCEATNQWETATLYIGGDLPSAVFLRDKNDGHIIGYTNCKIVLVEV